MIRLREAVLVRFGKFHDFSITFSDGLQIIYGGNEAGKSTIQLFLKVMLYGIIGNKKDTKGLKIRERIIPWEEKNAEGILRIDLDGRSVEIRRKFGKTSSGDKTEVVDFYTGEVVSGLDGSNLGEQLLGIPEVVFEKTFWLQQGSVAFSGSDDVISKRLLNLMETGDEEFSSAEVLQELENEKRLLKAKDKRSNPGELDRLWSLREEKMKERYKLLSERSQREAEENVLKQESQKLEELRMEETRLQELSERKKKTLVLESRRKKWDEAKKLEFLAKQAEERDVFQRFSDLEESIVQNAENLEKRRETLDQTATIEYDIEKEKATLLQNKKEERRFGYLLFVGVVFVLVSAVLAVLRFELWHLFSAVLGIAGIVLFSSCFLKMQKAKTESWHLAEKINDLLNYGSENKAEREQLETEYQNILAEFNCHNAAELREGYLLCKQAKLEAEGYRRTCQAVLEGEDISELSADMEEINLYIAKNADLLSVNVEVELQKVRQGQMECIARIKETESKLSYVFHGGLNPADTETELIQINHRIEELEKRQKALDLAIEVFGRVAERRKSDFTPKVNERVNTFLDILTDGKYRDARVSEEFQLRLLPDKAHLYQAEFFSSGTYDQVYFALRLSLASLLGDGTEPLFLDDFLTSYDDERAGLAMELLRQLGEKHQVLFFSCHGREVENAKHRNVIIRYLEEEGNDVC